MSDIWVCTTAVCHPRNETSVLWNGVFSFGKRG